MWQSSLLKNIPTTNPNQTMHLPRDIFVKCLESEWFKEIHGRMREAAAGHLEGEDYFTEIFQPFRLLHQEDDLEKFFKRILKVISLFFNAQGEVETVEKDIIFQVEGDALDKNH